MKLILEKETNELGESKWFTYLLKNDGTRSVISCKYSEKEALINFEEAGKVLQPPTVEIVKEKEL